VHLKKNECRDRRCGISADLFCIGVQLILKIGKEHLLIEDKKRGEEHVMRKLVALAGKAC
jgi:hypothetical protein